MLPTTAQFVVILSSWFQLGIIPLLEKEAVVLLVHDLLFVYVSVMFFQVPYD
jgi:hypothetical protein